MKLDERLPFRMKHTQIGQVGELVNIDHAVRCYLKSVYCSCLYKNVCQCGSEQSMQNHIFTKRSKVRKSDHAFVPEGIFRLPRPPAMPRLSQLTPLAELFPVANCCN